jgi:undecaprenyl-phosphate 4-deoxy-4-formamido-L-arabinose transferase
MIGKPRHIYLSPFKALRREIVEEVLRYTGPFAYVDGLILQATENLTQIDVDHHERYAGKGNYNLVRSVAVFMKLATSFSIAPLRFASLLGFAIAAFGIFLGIFYVVQYFITETVVQGWTTITVLVLLIGGMILTCLGLIGEYLGRTYLNLNHKPQYVVGEVLNGRSTRVHR